MLQVRSLGQYAPQPQQPYGYPQQQPYGYPQQPYGYVDPLVDAGLTAAGAVLQTSDPGAPETFQLIRRIIVAPPFPSFSLPGTPGSSSSHKLSDLNPALSTVAWVKENQGTAALLVLSIPVIAFLLGRSTRR